MKNWLSLCDWRQDVEHHRAVWHAQKIWKARRSKRKRRKRCERSGLGGGGILEKGKPVAAKSAHSAALLDRLRNINLQHYRLGEGVIPIGMSFLTRLVYPRPAPPLWPNGFRISSISISTPNSDNSITNLFIAMENHC